MKKSVIIGIVIVIILLIVIVGGYLLIYSNNINYSCTKDYDCVSVDAGCCGCTSGGEAMSINRNYEEKYVQSLSAKCAAISCITVMSNDPSCFSKSVCKNNKCELETSCVKEGDYHGGYTFSPDYRNCCEGLTSVYSGIHFDNYTGECSEGPTDGPNICIKCGDGICGTGENKCNCPKDCGNQNILQNCSRLGNFSIQVNCQDGYACYESYSSDVVYSFGQAVPIPIDLIAGDGKCHKICEKDSDCPSETPFCLRSQLIYEKKNNVLGLCFKNYTYNCSFKNSQGCYKGCNYTRDCFKAIGIGLCDCINVNNNYYSNLGIVSQESSPSCQMNYCYCYTGTCEGGIGGLV